MSWGWLLGVFHLFFHCPPIYFQQIGKKGYEDLAEVQIFLEFRTVISFFILALSLSVSKCLVNYFAYKKNVEPFSFSKRIILCYPTMKV